MALFLASDRSGFVTGGEFLVDGGMTVGPRHSWDETSAGPLLDALGTLEESLPIGEDLELASRIVHMPLSWQDPAAETALALQEALAQLDRASLGLPEDFGLRLALHAGPVFRAWDPVMRVRGYAGRHVSRTARMEPVTPPGEVYVSEAFAALLALSPGAAVAHEYVGRMPLAKDAGFLRMYLLRRRRGGLREGV